MSVTKEIIWTCDGCGDFVQIEEMPSDWWVVGKIYPVMTTRSNMFQEMRHLCANCEPKIPRSTK